MDDTSLTLSSEQPLLHAIVFLLEMAAVSILTRKFNSYYASRPGMRHYNDSSVDHG